MKLNGLKNTEIHILARWAHSVITGNDKNDACPAAQEGRAETESKGRVEFGTWRGMEGLGTARDQVTADDNMKSAAYK